MARNDLEDRLINFAISAVQLAEQLPKSVIGIQLSGNLIRASSSTPLNYGEAQGAESRKDFVHKIKIVLKELRESHAALKMVAGLNLNQHPDATQLLIKEANELISIFVKSVQTARKNDALMSKYKKL